MIVMTSHNIIIMKKKQRKIMALQQKKISNKDCEKNSQKKQFIGQNKNKNSLGHLHEQSYKFTRLVNVGHTQGVPLTYTPIRRPNYNCLRQAVDTTLKYIYLSFSGPNFIPLGHYLMYFIHQPFLVRQKSKFSYKFIH